MVGSTNNNDRTTAARAFVRSLNILLKFARMYDFGHPRTTAQYETAWSELRSALGSEEGGTGLLLAVSGDRLLLDGTPLESAAAEKGFARMLSSSGIASLHFSPKVTKASLAKFARAFPTGTNTKPTQIAEQLKAALEGDPHIQVNEVCYVPADSSVAKSTVAAQLAARTLGISSEKTDQLFSDPEKLLQLIVAAEGNKRTSDGSGNSGATRSDTSNSQNTDDVDRDNSSNYYVGENPDLITKNDSAYSWDPRNEKHVAATPETDSTSGDFSDWNNTQETNARRSSSSGPESVKVQAGSIPLKETELQGILQVLGQIGQKSEFSHGKLDLSSLQSQLAALPRRSQFTVNQVLATLAAQSSLESQDGSALLKLAEHIAVRFALESYERGDTKVDAVQQILNQMNEELDSLRKIVGVYEEKMTEAGIEVHSQAEVLARTFWTQLPEEKKTHVLESDEAWCVPPAAVRDYAERLRSSGKTEAAEKVLRNYAGYIASKVPEHRRQAATGIAELASLYASASQKLFLDTIRIAGVQFTEETDPALQSLASAAFVRLSQEAVSKRLHAALQRIVEMMDYAESEHPGLAKNLRSRIGIENRLPEFIEEALKNGETPSGLMDLLRRVPFATSEHIATRFGRAVLVEESESLLWMMEALGPEAIEHLRTRFERGESNDTIETIGMLTRVSFETIQRELPGRIKNWKHASHDRVVRQIAASGSSKRGRLLLELFDSIDPLVRPAVIDEIGMSGERSADMRLLRIAEGELPKHGSEYLRIKAVEALGRLATSEAEAVLRKIAEARKTFRWAHSYELRLVATQAMSRINSDWTQGFIPRSDLSIADLMIEPLNPDPESLTTCQRRYVRFRLDPPVVGLATNLKKSSRLEVREMSLSGGVAISEQALHPGGIIELRLSTGRKSVQFKAVIRRAAPQGVTFEIVDIDLEERTKLRKLLVQLGEAPKPASLEDQNSSSQQTISVGPKDDAAQ
jgi:hypothetical protein